MKRLSLAAVACWGALFIFGAGPLTAQTETPAPATEAASPAAEKAAPSLSDRQEQLAQKYRQLEAVLLRMAELSDDPERVALLRKAVAQSKQQLIGEQLVDIVALLERERLANALTEQGEVRQDMNKLLELLLSEDRGQNLDEEKQRLQQWIRDITGLIKDQQGLQGETEGGADSKGLSERQGALAEKTKGTADEIAEADAKARGEKSPSGNEAKPAGENGSPSEGQGKEGEGKEGEPKEGEPKEGEAKEGESKEGESKESEGNEGEPKETESKPSEPSEGQPSEGQPSEGQPSEGQPSEGQPSEGQPSEGQPSEGQPSEGQPSESNPSEQEPRNPTEQKLKSAQQKMQAAKKKLEEAERKEAIQDQTEAIRELRAAKAELEKILQQLREEEMQRMLAMLEQRFRKMLAAQVDILEATERLDSVAVADRTRNDEIEAGRQSRREMELGDEARKALELLKQDGTAVAFPEAVRQLIEDMDQTAAWLGEAKVGVLTQALEQDIIASLEEMIAALEKAQKELEEKDESSEGGEGGGGGEPAEPPLVDNLAELKMVRSLQMWVNKRTQLYRMRLEGELKPEEQADLQEGIAKLAERQDRIFRTTRDIAQGKNQ
jgi:hypothetical protein